MSVDLYYTHNMDFFFFNGCQQLLSKVFKQRTLNERGAHNSIAPRTEQSAFLIVYLAPFSFSSTKNNFLQMSVCYRSQEVKEHVKVFIFSCCCLEKEEN